MRKVTYKILFTFSHTVKGEKGDTAKSELNTKIETILDRNKGVRRYMQKSSKRKYHSQDESGEIISEYEIYVSDDVDLTSESETPPIGEINHDLWTFLNEMISRGSVSEILTDNIDNSISSVPKEEQINIDLNDSSYKNSQGSAKAPEFKTVRTLHTNEEFDMVFEEIMDQLRERLSLRSDEYKLSRSIMKKEQTEWNCEQCGKKDVQLHHELVRSAVKRYFRDKLAHFDGFVIDEETGQVFIEGTTVTKHVANLVHNPDVLTPLCQDCHTEVHI